MTFFDFIDKHWGFWFAVFLLMLSGSLTRGVIAVIALFAKKHQQSDKD